MPDFKECWIAKDFPFRLKISTLTLNLKGIPDVLILSQEAVGPFFSISVSGSLDQVLSFTWENCGPNTNPIILQELSLRRTGDLFYVSMKMNVAENITQPIEANMRIKKKVPFFNYYIDVPCIDNVGSCDYKDICTIDPWKNKPCPKEFVKNNLPCRCPLIQNHYEVKELPLDLGPFENEIKGAYKVKLLLQKGGNELFCLKMKIKI